MKITFTKSLLPLVKTTTKQRESMLLNILDMEEDPRVIEAIKQLLLCGAAVLPKIITGRKNIDWIGSALQGRKSITGRPCLSFFSIQKGFIYACDGARTHYSEISPDTSYDDGLYSLKDRELVPVTEDCGTYPDMASMTIFKPRSRQSITEVEIVEFRSLDKILVENNAGKLELYFKIKDKYYNANYVMSAANSWKEGKFLENEWGRLEFTCQFGQSVVMPFILKD